MGCATKLNACEMQSICIVIIPASKPSCAVLTSFAALYIVK